MGGYTLEKRISFSPGNDDFYAFEDKCSIVSSSPNSGRASFVQFSFPAHDKEAKGLALPKEEWVLQNTEIEKKETERVDNGQKNIENNALREKQKNKGKLRWLSLKTMIFL